MKIFVLGHRGMLGHVVARYLTESGYAIVTSDSRYAGLPRDPLIEEARHSGCAWVVNALGRIKQKSDDPADLYLVNSRLPAQLRVRLLPEQKLVHASTDCVFSGRRGDYAVFEENDADDVYGFSKILGDLVVQPGRCFVLRTSIIGPALNDASGLMGWFLSQTKPVKGFVNHRWNGITTLEWAKACRELIEGKLPMPTGIAQLGVAPAVSKYELLRIISEAWGHSIPIHPAEAPDAVDRTLQPDIVRIGLSEQLKEFKRWYTSSAGCACVR